MANAATIKRRIVFVDDERRVLEGLERLLRPQRRVWEMSFCATSEEALRILDTSPVDVVVSDMRMPGMDGADLLARAKQRQPQCVRIVLSGQTSEASAFRAVPAAHQFITKPCDPAVLRDIIERSCELRNLLNNDDLAALVGGIDALPCAPSTYIELTEILAGDSCTVADIARIVERDVALSAKILQIANSAFFGLRRRVAHIESAVGYLGAELIRGLALSVAAFREVRPMNPAVRAALEGVQEHALRTAFLCKTFFEEPAVANSAFTAALLHDVGKLILGATRGEEYEELLVKARSSREALHELECYTFGASHSEVGAYLLGIWGLPHTVVEAVAAHHKADIAPSKLDITAAVQVADALALEAETRQTTDDDNSIIARLEIAGFAQQIARWREIAANSFND